MWCAWKRASADVAGCNFPSLCSTEVSIACRARRGQPCTGGGMLTAPCTSLCPLMGLARAGLTVLGKKWLLLLLGSFWEQLCGHQHQFCFHSFPQFLWRRASSWGGLTLLAGFACQIIHIRSLWFPCVGTCCKLLLMSHEKLVEPNMASLAVLHWCQFAVGVEQKGVCGVPWSMTTAVLWVSSVKLVLLEYLKLSQ